MVSIRDTQLHRGFVALARRQTFANLTSTWMFGYRNEEIEVSGRDPEEVMRQLPDDVVSFRFYDRIIADVTVDGEDIRIRSDHLEWSEGCFYVDVDRIYTRKELDARPKWRDNGLDCKVRDKLKKHKSVNHVAFWDTERLHALMLYRPDVDHLLTRA